jgi:hypothetical protein
MLPAPCTLGEGKQSHHRQPNANIGARIEYSCASPAFKITRMTAGDLLNLPAGVLAAAATLLAGGVAAGDLDRLYKCRTAKAAARETFRRARGAAMLHLFFGGCKMWR